MDPAFNASGVVLSVLSARRLIVSNLEGFPNGFFSRGLIRWTGGGNLGASTEVVAHRRTEGGVELEVLEVGTSAFQPADTFTIRIGCDKTFATCRDKFSNQENFRGFPHMPGEDMIQAAPASGQRHDGTTRNG